MSGDADARAADAIASARRAQRLADADATVLLPENDRLREELGMLREAAWRVVDEYHKWSEDANDGEFALSRAEDFINAIVALRSALVESDPCPGTGIPSLFCSCALHARAETTFEDLCARLGHDEIALLASTMSTDGVRLRCLRCSRERFIEARVEPPAGREHAAWCGVHHGSVSCTCGVVVEGTGDA